MNNLFPAKAITLTPEAVLRPAYQKYLEDNFGPMCEVAHANSGSRPLAAVIVECRSLPHIASVLRNFLVFLEGRFNLHVVHGSANRDLIERITASWTIDRVELETDNLDIAAYDRLLKSTLFWRKFESCERVLVFQSDCVAVDQFDERFLEFDLVGAPCGPDGRYFNGGLSLRNPRRMLEAIARYGAADDPVTEDIFFTEALRRMGAALPDPFTATQFALESNYLAHPFGVHGTDKFYHKDEVAQAVTREGALCLRELRGTL